MGDTMFDQLTEQQLRKRHNKFKARKHELGARGKDARPGLEV